MAGRDEADDTSTSAASAEVAGRRRPVMLSNRLPWAVMSNGINIVAAAGQAHVRAVEVEAPPDIVARISSSLKAKPTVASQSSMPRICSAGDRRRVSSRGTYVAWHVRRARRRIFVVSPWDQAFPACWSTWWRWPSPYSSARASGLLKVPFTTRAKGTLNPLICTVHVPALPLTDCACVLHIVDADGRAAGLRDQPAAEDVTAVLRPARRRDQRFEIVDQVRGAVGRRIVAPHKFSVTRFAPHAFTAYRVEKCRPIRACREMTYRCCAIRRFGHVDASPTLMHVGNGEVVVVGAIVVLVEQVDRPWLMSVALTNAALALCV